MALHFLFLCLSWKPVAGIMGVLADFHYAPLSPRPTSAFACNNMLRGIWCDAFEVTELGTVQAVCCVTWF